MLNLQLLKCALCLWVFGAVCLMAESYPTIAPLRRTFAIEEAGQANVVLEIRSPEGTALYKLQCHSAGYAGDPDFEYSGDFECRLSSIGRPDTFSTLLTEDPHQSRDWESRGRFFAADLSGSCAHIPQFGTNRMFRLRGMKLALEVIDPVFTTSGKLSSLKLTVEVNPDPSAKTPIAEAVPLPKNGVPSECKLETYFVDPSTFLAQQQIGQDPTLPTAEAPPLLSNQDIAGLKTGTEFAVMVGVLEVGEAGGGIKLLSSIGEDTKLVKYAEDAENSVQKGLDHLVEELGKGNTNPGLGTKGLGDGISYARARDGARVFFKQAQDTITILAKARACFINIFSA